ncbi:hypothetical protein CEXT_687961 [Caerostris extrusa]|uniref:Uncharacterized protein n=1 Tax=Caerostris extrusa TaxID=172846 RepID=A0AAV4SCA6_CAEEX|nr:hypothetical protein CEXT_687961 [Caerostris extrusa]
MSLENQNTNKRSSASFHVFSSTTSNARHSGNLWMWFLAEPKTTQSGLLRGFFHSICGGARFLGDGLADPNLKRNDIAENDVTCLPYGPAPHQTLMGGIR